jgi:hypothetical protein
LIPTATLKSGVAQRLFELLALPKQLPPAPAPEGKTTTFHPGTPEEHCCSAEGNRLRLGALL